jgi:hypothetical protein
MSGQSSSASVNHWQPSGHDHVPAELLKPIKDPAAWAPEDYADKDNWLYRLSDAEVGEVMDAVAAVEKQGLALMEINRDNFHLPRFGKMLHAIREEIMLGRGFCVLRGMPVEGRSKLQVATAFWGIGNWVGRPVSQNQMGHMLGHVKDIGGDYSVGRGYNTKAGLAFHSDRCDIVSLCCLQPAKSGGAHRIASSVNLYNKMVASRPDLVAELAKPLYRSRRGEIPPGETKPWFLLPVFFVTDGYFAARPPGTTVGKAQGMPGVPEMTPLQREAISTFNRLALECSFDIDFQPGDISFLQNFVTMHGRTDFDDWPEPERKRHLFRLWLTTGGVRPLDDRIIREVSGVAADPALLSTPLDAS